MTWGPKKAGKTGSLVGKSPSSGKFGINSAVASHRMQFGKPKKAKVPHPLTGTPWAPAPKANMVKKTLSKPMHATGTKMPMRPHAQMPNVGNMGDSAPVGMVRGGIRKPKFGK